MLAEVDHEPRKRDGATSLQDEPRLHEIADSTATRCQRVADGPEEDFEEYLAETQENELGIWLSKQRREAVVELTEGERLSTRQAADVLGVDEATVRRDAANATPEPSFLPESVADATSAT